MEMPNDIVNKKLHLSTSCSKRFIIIFSQMQAGRKVTAHYLAQKECGASTATGLVSVSMGPPVVRSRGNASAPLDGLGRNVSYHARYVTDYTTGCYQVFFYFS